VVEAAKPPEETTRMPPLETAVLMTLPPCDTISVAKLPKPEPEMPMSVAESPLPPSSMISTPPPSTLVLRATPPERTTSVPPLLTMSKFEVTPDEMKNGEFAEVMMLPVMGAVHPVGAQLQTCARRRRAAGEPRRRSPYFHEQFVPGRMQKRTRPGPSDRTPNTSRREAGLWGAQMSGIPQRPARPQATPLRRCQWK
jgi:hypothetical protein